MEISSVTSNTNLVEIYTHPGDQNVKVARIKITTSGDYDPLELSQITFLTPYTTDLGDVAKAKVFYTGTSSVFATYSQIGTDYNF